MQPASPIYACRNCKARFIPDGPELADFPLDQEAIARFCLARQPLTHRCGEKTFGVADCVGLQVETPTS